MSELARLVPIRLTAEEWERIGEDDNRYELVEGLLTGVPAEAPRNAAACGRLMVLLGMHSRDARGSLRFEVFGPVEIDATLSADAFPTYRITDATVVRSGARTDGSRLESHDLLMAVEIVSPGSEHTDYVYKRAEYALAGVPGYLIVDVRPGSDRLVYLTLASEGSYSVAGEGRSVTLELAGVSVPVSIADLTG